METILKANDLVKIYKSPWSRHKVTALDHFSLEVPKGEIFGLLGPNGSGKTTAMKSFLGLVRLNRGDIKLFNEPPQKMSVKRRIGFLPEESYHYKFLTAQESLDFFGSLAGLSSKAVRERSPAVLKEVDLTHAKDRRVSKFSKGMLRRLGFAFILLKDPDLIFLDEPTVGLDPLGTLHVREIMLNLKARGKTIVLSSHLLGEIENVCDRVAILYNGKLMKQDTLSNILAVQDKVQVILNQTQNSTPEKIREILEKQGFKIDSISHPKKTLESAFVETLHLPK
jgi:ABC-2 type transport system ATP-binding protein